MRRHGLQFSSYAYVHTYIQIRICINLCGLLWFFSYLTQARSWGDIEWWRIAHDIYRSSFDYCSLVLVCQGWSGWTDDNWTNFFCSIFRKLHHLFLRLTRESSDPIMTLLIPLSTYFLSTSHLWRYPAVYLALVRIICFYSHPCQCCGFFLSLVSLSPF